MSLEIKGLEGMGPEERMEYLLSFAKALLETEKDPLALMSNLSAIIMGVVEDLNWAGFYLVQGKELVLGPFQGLPACTRLDYNTGVCAKAWRDQTLVRVDDVHAVADHIACDSASNSELVIPLLYQGSVYGVLDLDSPIKARFTPIEEEGIQRLVDLVQEAIYLK